MKRQLFTFLILLPHIVTAQTDTINASRDSVLPNMSHSFSLNAPMNRNGSGTSWLPDASAMYGYGMQTKKWMYMFNGNLFFRYNNQDITNKGKRGDKKLDAPAWLMLMGQKKSGRKVYFILVQCFL